MPVEAITVNIGDSKFPPDGASGGSTTIGRRLRLHAPRLPSMRWTSYLPLSPPALGVPADQLMAVGGKIQAKGDSFQTDFLEGSLRQAAG